MSKIIMVFLVILMIFGGVIGYQYFKQQSNRTEVKINDQSFAAEVASKPEEWQQGLSDRKSLGEKQAMLFVFDEKKRHSFWMNKMKFPIDIIFIDGNKIVYIKKDAQPPASPDEELEIFQPDDPADKVLEINAGLSDKYGFKPGDEVIIEVSPTPTEEQAAEEK